MQWTWYCEVLITVGGIQPNLGNVPRNILLFETLDLSLINQTAKI